MNTAFRLIFIMILLATSSPSYAYLDPGTGTMILQVILGGVAGVVLAGKMFWAQIVGFFRRPFAAQADSEAAAGDKSSTAPPAERQATDDRA